MRRILAIAAATTALALAVPAVADEHMTPELAAALADERRDDERARDQYRHPAETLHFFQVEPDMTVVEYGPGDGWYTRVLLPYISQNGTYMAINGDSDARSYPDRAAEVRSKGWVERFVGQVTDGSPFTADDVTAFETDEIPEGVEGTVDRVLIFRSLHGMRNGNQLDRELQAVRSLLADNGMVGVVQHRAPADASYKDSKGTRGYLRQADVIALFELHGFELVDSSELNANPNDPADWEGGVWTLPPVLRYGDQDRERYTAIGESDRMTLLFRKRQ